MTKEKCCVHCERGEGRTADGFHPLGVGKYARCGLLPPYEEQKASLTSKPVVPDWLREVRTELIKLAAAFVRGDSVPDWSEHKWYATTPLSERRDVLRMLRDVDETMRQYGIQLKKIADKLPGAINAVETTDWQPMETAPKSRSDAGKDREYVLVVYPGWKDGKPDPFVITAFQDSLGWDTGVWRLHEKPTCWMPLPKPPGLPLEPDAGKSARVGSRIPYDIGVRGGGDQPEQCGVVPPVKASVTIVGPTCGKDTPDGPCLSDRGHQGDCDGLPY